MLSEQTAAYHALFDAIADAILVIDGAARIVDANPAAAALLGYTPVELLTMRVTDITSGASAWDGSRFVVFGEGSTWRGGLALRCKDGSLAAVEARSAGVTLPGGEACVVVLREATERKPADHLLHRSDLLLAEAQQIAHLGSWEWDVATDRVTWSDELYRIFGLPPQQLTLTFEAYLQRVAPADREMARDIIEGAYRDRRPFSFDHRIVRPDGTERIVHARGDVVLDAHGEPIRMIGTGQDVTDLRQAEEERARLVREQAARAEAEAAERRLRFLIGNAADVILVLDPAGQVRYASPAVTRVLGYDPEAHLGANVFEFVHPDDAARVRDAFAGALPQPGTHQWIEFRIRHADESWRYVEAAANVVLDEPTVKGVVVNLRDITERKRVEDERLQHLAREQAARAEAEEALRIRDEIVSVISHDLKAPLTAITAYAQLLGRGAARSSIGTAEAAASIDAAARKMAAMIDDLLDAARLQSGRALDLERAFVDLVALVSRVAEEQQRATERHRIWVAPAEPDVIGWWDGPRLERVAANIIANAIKYTPAGGDIVVTVTTEQKDGRRWACLAVRDPGIGIPAADLPHIFERFHRGGNVRGRVPGTGIGLAGARYIVEQHGGAITVESREGDGTTVTVCLPL